MAFKGLDMAFSDLRKGLGVLQVLSGESYSASFVQGLGPSPGPLRRILQSQGVQGGSEGHQAPYKAPERLIRPLRTFSVGRLRLRTTLGSPRSEFRTYSRGERMLSCITVDTIHARATMLRRHMHDPLVAVLWEEMIDLLTHSVN